MAESLMDSHKSFQLGLKVLGYIGLDPTKRTPRAIIISGISFACALLLTTWTLAGFFEKNLNLQRFAKLCQTLGTIIFILVKQYVLIAYWDDIKMVMCQPVMYWSRRNKELTEEISLDKVFKIFGAFVFLCTFNCIVIILKPWMQDELPLAFYSPSINYWIIYFIQVIYMQYVLVITLASDIIYTSICVYYINQLRHLACLFESLTFSDEQEMKKGVRRHVELMRAINKIAKVYSIVFTTTIWIMITVMCVESYVDINTVNTFVGYFRHCSVYLGALAVCSFYIILASNVTDEGLNIAEAIYKSKWYEADRPVKKYVLIVMMKAQVPINFTANGFVVISRLTILFILQTAYSYYTVFRTMKMAHPQN